MNLTRRRFLHATFAAAILAASSGLFAAVAQSASTADAPRRIPVVFHTDIGTDIDDTWALAQLLRSPELDLKLVLVDTGDTQYRAALAAKLLEAAGRSDIPVALGVSGPMLDRDKNLLPWITGYDLAKYPGKVHADGVAEFIRVVTSSPTPVTVISVGAVPALAQAVQRAPELAKRAKFVGMFGSFDVGYGDKPPASAESNVKVDPAALRTVLAAPWMDILLTPLDTCGSVRLEGGAYHAIWSATHDPILRAVIESYCIFAPRVWWMKCGFFTQQSTTLFDCVAVYLAYSEDLVETERVRFSVSDDGFTRRSADGVTARVALRWKDRGAFEDHLTHRLLGQ
jgi:inosine-uridine nucleoside N-ribohydrolase